MTPVRRWLLIAAGVCLLVLSPTVIRSLPVADSEVSAAELLQRVKDSGSVAYSGYAEAVGGMQLPVSDQFSDLAQLLGERTRLRVWWRADDDWRVDALDITGETDLIRSADGLAIWEYEAARATYTDDAPVRLPRAADLVPPVLGRLVLGEAMAEEVSRLPAVRVAGREVPGLRLTPADSQTTVDHVDVWVDPDTGLALRVDIFGAGDTPAMTTTFLDLTTQPPAAADTAFTPPPDADVDYDEAVDIAAAADRFAPITAPDRLAGLDRRTTPGVGAVGQYGRGVARLIAIPLRDEGADPLREQLLTTTSSRSGRRGVSVTVGPLGLLLTPDAYDRPTWLLGGTVTQRTLSAAARELAGGPVLTR